GIRDLIVTGSSDVCSSDLRGTLAADLAVDPARLLQVNVSQLITAITRYEVQLAADWPFDVAAQTHFAIGQLRAAVARLGTGDYRSEERRVGKGCRTRW